MYIDIKRVIRTALQSLCGAAAASFEAIVAAQFSNEVVLTTLLSLGVTVVIAILMNISDQLSVDTEEPSKGRVNWMRVLRTLVQAACGAAAVFLESTFMNFNQDVLIAGAIQFGVTVVTAVFMNISKQLED